MLDGREARDVPDAEPAVTDGALSADVTAPTALDVDGAPRGVGRVCGPTGGVLTGGVWIGGTVTVGVLSVGVLMLGVLTVGVVIVGVVIGPTVTEGTVIEGTDTDGTDTVGSGGTTEEIDGSVSRVAPAVLWATGLPRAAAVDSAAPASRAAHATSTVSSRSDPPPLAARPMNERVVITPVLLLSRKAAGLSLQHRRRRDAGSRIAGNDPHRLRGLLAELARKRDLTSSSRPAQRALTASRASAYTYR